MSQGEAYRAICSAVMTLRSNLQKVKVEDLVVKNGSGNVIGANGSLLITVIA